MGAHITFINTVIRFHYSISFFWTRVLLMQMFPTII